MQLPIRRVGTTGSTMQQTHPAAAMISGKGNA
jgi:hypothetical protein